MNVCSLAKNGDPSRKFLDACGHSLWKRALADLVAAGENQPALINAKVSLAQLPCERGGSLLGAVIPTRVTIAYFLAEFSKHREPRDFELFPGSACYEAG